MGWLSGKVQKWATNTQARELQEFVARLAAMDGEEVGMVLATATHHRHHAADRFGWDLMEPTLAEMRNPMLAVQIGQIIKTLQKEGRPELAAGYFVWLHTVRAANNPDLRQLGRDMWRELGRAMPFVESAALGWSGLTGAVLNIREFERCPAGLSPEPQ
ncbi:hypothetical protein [Mesorhizobium sp.]|uniref:hypothetical protein n=1 Tax=Mesorhizobium sp. TaxID=1871066 RepID=UPI00121EC448|nr:hypothetical protein [Mesorhizobium sp.]TIQ46746.1 MAG: hypothetical protein E5X47_23415 [Mesorhizobium sp.]TIQ56519.1 MAG: hypothetical protein E5X46_18780 [Mesorhizobium sp.]